MKWEVVIGLETHAQLSTASKILSGASTAFGAAPNTQAAAGDIALPGWCSRRGRRAIPRLRGRDHQPAQRHLRAQELLYPTC
jgi:aspartyl-tRNA(Asn)/glutamyl-tRNA(Gln) amidotransferase subunit B